jgi:hypothetical protein
VERDPRERGYSDVVEYYDDSRQVDSPRSAPEIERYPGACREDPSNVSQFKPTCRASIAPPQAQRAGQGNGVRRANES